MKIFVITTSTIAICLLLVALNAMVMDYARNMKKKRTRVWCSMECFYNRDGYCASKTIIIGLRGRSYLGQPEYTVCKTRKKIDHYEEVVNNDD